MRNKCWEDIKKEFKFKFMSFNYYTKSEFGEILIYGKDAELIDVISCDCNISDFYHIYRIFKDTGCEASENRRYAFTEI